MPEPPPINNHVRDEYVRISDQMLLAEVFLQRSIYNYHLSSLVHGTRVARSARLRVQGKAALRQR